MALLSADEAEALSFQNSGMSCFFCLLYSPYQFAEACTEDIRQKPEVMYVYTYISSGLSVIFPGHVWHVASYIIYSLYIIT